MPTATLQPSPAGAGLGGTITGTSSPTTTMPSQQQQQQASKPQPLRRAVYVHVSDLLSAYNIDHAKLDEELQRVKGCADAATSTTGGGVPTELDTNSNPKKLQPPRGGFNLCVLVGKVDLVVDKHRVDGSRVRLAEVEVGDETGRVSLRARDEQIDLLEQVAARNAAVVLRNCTLELFQGKHIRLAVTKWGKITPYPDHVASTPVPPGKMNDDRYLSLIDLSVVALDAAVHATDAYTGGLVDEGGYGGSGNGGGAAAGGGSGGTREGAQASSATTRGRSGGMGRKQTGRGTGSKASQQQQQPPHTTLQPYGGPVAYGDAATMMRYQGGLHGYGYVENHPMGGAGADAYGAPSYHHPHAHHHHHHPRNTPSAAASAHMMLQQQYEMHQRQIHSMYQQQNRHHVAPSYSDSTAAFRSDMFLSPAAGQMFHTTAPPLERGTTPPGTATPSTMASTSHFPASPKMNPRAATFDPATGKPSSSSQSS